MSDKGAPSWNTQPCPLLMFHGTEDTLVKYTKTQAFKLGIFGTSSLVERHKQQGYPYWAVRVEGHGHDGAACMVYRWTWEKDGPEQGSLKVYDGELE